MESSRPAFIFLLIISIQLCTLTIVQSNKLIQLCSFNSNFTVNSTYGNNLNHLFSTITSDSQIDYGFYNLSYGKNSDKVNAIGLCRGDVKPYRCRRCIIGATSEFSRLCPNQREAIVWYDKCMLRYSNRSIFGKMEFEPAQPFINVNNVSDVNQFNQALTPLLDGLRTQAASGDSLLKFAAGKANTSDSETIYASAQCTPDLSRGDCNNCLSNATEFLSDCCSGKQGARILTASCIVRYEIYIFYDPLVDTSPPMASPPAPAPAPGPAVLSTPAPAPAPAPGAAAESPAPPSPTSSPAPTQLISAPPQPNIATRKGFAGNLNSRFQVLATMQLVALIAFQYFIF